VLSRKMTVLSQKVTQASFWSSALGSMWIQLPLHDTFLRWPVDPGIWLNSKNYLVGLKDKDFTEHDCSVVLIAHKSSDVLFHCPPFTGLGIGMVLVSIYCCVYYNVIIMWTLYYFFHSFKKILPWSTCENNWNSDDCSLLGFHRGRCHFPLFYSSTWPSFSTDRPPKPEVCWSGSS